MKSIKNILFYLLLPVSVSAQVVQKDSSDWIGLTDVPELTMTTIPGAPILKKPILVMGDHQPLSSQGHGISAPAFYDWDGDGLKDLLIGEFGSGLEFGKLMGNFVRVYLNIGTDSQPEFANKFDYARPPFEFASLNHGTPYSVDQYCCIGFAPQFFDLNSDDKADMITGQYQGEVVWFEGSDNGFLPGKELPQEGNPRDKQWVKNQYYWMYSSASFGDLTGDGLLDLITGGSSLRLSKNVGNKANPEFSKRELLLDKQGNPLKVYNYSAEELAEKERYLMEFKSPIPPANDYDLSPYVVDWDNDGVLDLLVTNSYSHMGLSAVNFFRGVSINGKHSFESARPLFNRKNKEKELPGSAPRIFVTDWNNDGVNDLLIGVSIVTVNGKFSQELSWKWERDSHLLGPGKDPANLNENTLTPSQFERYKDAIKLPEGISLEQYLTIRHKGYVYLMLGTSAPSVSEKSKGKSK